MKYFSTLSPKHLRLLITIATAAVFVVSILNFAQVMVYRVTSNDQCRWVEVPAGDSMLTIHDVVPGGVTDRAGVVDGDTLLRINGKTFHTVGQAQQIIDAHGVGEHVTYTLRRGARTFDTSIEIIKVFNIPFLAFFILGLGFLLVGYVVAMTKPEGFIQRKFGRFGLAAMLLFGFYGLRQAIPDNPFLSRLLIVSLVAGYILSIPQFIGFFLHYPVRRKVAGRKWTVPLLYLFSVLNVVLAPLGQYLGVPQPLLWIPVGMPYAAFVAGIVIFCRSYFTAVPADRKAALKPVLIGMIVGGAGIVYILGLSIVNPFALFFTPWLSLPGVLVLGIPATFGYSIFRYRLMDIDLIVKRSLIYGLVTASIAAIYLLIVYGVGSLIAYMLGTEENRLLNIAAFILIALVFDPIKRRIQSWIDLGFYRERLNYQKALLEFSQELPTKMNLPQIMDSIVQRISTTMHVEKVAVIVRDGAGGLEASSKGIPRADCTAAEIDTGLLRLLAATGRPASLSFLGDDHETTRMTPGEKEVLQRSGVVLAIPMALQDRLVGCIAAGEKLSGKVYSQEDIDLLSTVAGQAAIAIENARLHTSEVERQKLEEELAMARRIQAGLFPKHRPTFGGLELAGTSIPATSVGGDYYDYIQLGNDRLLVVVADVSGKGMSAALYMSKIQGMIQLAAHMYASPREMLVHVNRRLYDGIERNSFITMVLGLFDLGKKEVVLCRAGHNRPLVSTNGGCRFLGPEGIGLGLERGQIFEEHLEELRLPLTHGSLFVLYSDGLTEARNPEAAEFGEETLRALVERDVHLPAETLQQNILDTVNTFRGSAEQHDDITLLTIRYR
jgi:sigma-B regulation protein RsbU (phosphoserine phosphatase)